MIRLTLSSLVALSLLTAPAAARGSSAPPGHCSARIPVTLDDGGRFRGVAGNVRCEGWIGYAGADPTHAGTLELTGAASSRAGCLLQPRDGRIRLTSSRLITIGIEPEIVMSAAWTAAAATLAGTGVSGSRSIALSGAIHVAPADPLDCHDAWWVQIDLLLRDAGRMTSPESDPAPQAEPPESQPARKAAPRTRRTCRKRSGRAARKKRCARRQRQR